MFDQLVDEAFDVLWGLNPAWAVYLGLHEYDGMVPDWSDDEVAAALDRLRRTAGRLDDLDGLTADQRVDRRQLTAAIDRQIFEWEELRTARRNPMTWIYALDPDLYLKRAYAPPAVRAEAVAELLGQAPAFLDQARRRLDAVIPRTMCEWGIVASEGVAEMVETDVAAAFPEVGGATGDALGRAAGEAAAALRSFTEWLRTERLPRSDDDFAIGRAAMEELLRVSEMVSMDLDDLLEMGEADLARNLQAFRETAAAIDGSLGPRAVYERYVASVHATPETLIPATAAMLEEIRQFVVDADIITIPSEVRAKVAATPKHLRWAFAMMDTPGPYETESTEAYYYVTPVEAEWSDRQAEEWLRTLNTYALEDISIHEAYPGHYVHFLHYDHAPTEVSKRLTSYAFVEGWAHYVEQMMWEEGYRSGDDRFRLAQLSEALVRNCRFVCALKLHAHGMSVDEATLFFVENAYYEEGPARKEAERGTFDPGYFSYTLGKLQILELREDYRKARGPDSTLRGFHDALLSRGAPPVELMRTVLL